MDDFVTPEQLCDFCGADADDPGGIISAARVSALAELKSAVGDPGILKANAGIANEAVRVMVYISYYGVRDGVQNLDFLRQRKTELVKMLQYGDAEVAADGDGQEGGSASD